MIKKNMKKFPGEFLSYLKKYYKYSSFLKYFFFRGPSCLLYDIVDKDDPRCKVKNKRVFKQPIGCNRGERPIDICRYNEVRKNFKNIKKIIL